MEVYDIPDELKVTLAAARKNAGYTQKEVAEKLNVSNRTVLAWEKGEIDVPFSMAQKMCEMYNRPIYSIIFGKKSH